MLLADLIVLTEDTTQGASRKEDGSTARKPLIQGSSQWWSAARAQKIPAGEEQ